MMAENLPYFKFYPADFMGSGKVQIMSPAERGIYISLLCHSWQEGPLPDDVARLARVSGASLGEMREAWPSVRPCFEVDDDGRLYHPRLEKEREAALHRRRMAKKAARASAKSRGADAPADVTADAGADAQASATTDAPADGGATARRNSESQSLRVQSTENSESHGPEEKTGAVVAGRDSTEGPEVKASDLVAAWVDRQPSGPSAKEKSKQGAAAKRICDNHPRERIAAAWVGMDQLFPHSDGQPWDLFDLERKFSKACEAAMEHPEAKDHVRKAEMMAALEKAG